VASSSESRHSHNTYAQKSLSTPSRPQGFVTSGALRAKGCASTGSASKRGSTSLPVGSPSIWLDATMGRTIECEYDVAGIFWPYLKPCGDKKPVEYDSKRPVVYTLQVKERLH